MAPRPRQRGVTLIEFMIAMAVGLVIVLAASTAFLAGKRLFNTSADAQAVHESLRFTRHVVQGQLRQAATRTIRLIT
jgi:type IV pilus assembly protein PilW